MKEKDLTIDLKKHKVYSRNAKKCVLKLLRRYYDEKSAADLFEKIQLRYCEYLKGEPALAGKIFAKTSAIRMKEAEMFPESFHMGGFDFDKENGVVRYSFTKCPNAEFAKRHHMEDVLPVMCNCDHLAMRKLHAILIREGTCCSERSCDYCIVGDRNPLAQDYVLKKMENGLWVSVKKAEEWSQYEIL